LIKDYELEIHYHPGKANVVADALSRKSQVNMLAAHPMPYELAKEFDRLSLGFLNNTQGVIIELEPTLDQDIRKGQKDDEKINKIWQLIIDGKGKDFHEDAEGVVWFKDRLCVPDIKTIWELILKEAHETTYSIHPRSKKMYQDLKKRFWWYGESRLEGGGVNRAKLKFSKIITTTSRVSVRNIIESAREGAKQIASE
jgi:hypothetical protein